MYDPEHPYDDSLADPSSPEAAAKHILDLGDPKGGSTGAKAAFDPGKFAKMAAAAGAGGGGPGAPPLPTASADQDPESPLLEEQKRKFNAGSGDSSGMAGQVSSILQLFA